MIKIRMMLPIIIIDGKSGGVIMKVNKNIMILLSAILLIVCVAMGSMFLCKAMSQQLVDNNGFYKESDLLSLFLSLQTGIVSISKKYYSLRTHVTIFLNSNLQFSYTLFLNSHKQWKN